MIFIHIGQYKAASTTIQRFLTANSQLLAEHNIVYPRLSTNIERNSAEHYNQHGALASQQGDESGGPAWSELCALLQELPADQNVLLSAEGLLGKGPDVVRKALAAYDVKIICYVRDYSKHIISTYVHHTKRGTNLADFDDFFERSISRSRYDLIETLEPWANAFGAGNVRVALLDPRTLQGGDVRLDVLDAIGIDNAKNDGIIMTADANIAPGWKTVEILRQLNFDLWEDLKSRIPNLDMTQARRQSRRGVDGIPAQVFGLTQYLWNPASKIGETLGFTERGRYLTDVQFRQTIERFVQEMERLEDSGMDLRLAQPQEDGFVARTFLPSTEHIPSEEVAAFLRQLYSPMISHVFTERTRNERRERRESRRNRRNAQAS